MRAERRVLASVCFGLLLWGCGGSSGGGGGGSGPDTTPPTAPDLGRITVGAPIPGGISQIVGSGGAVEGSSQVRIVNVDATAREGQSVEVEGSANSGGSFSLALEAELGDQLALTATDAAGNTSAISFTTAGPVPLAFSGPVGTIAQRTLISGVGAVDFAFPTGNEEYLVVLEPQDPSGVFFPMQVTGAMGVAARPLQTAARRDGTGPDLEMAIRRFEREHVFPRLRQLGPARPDRALAAAQEEGDERMFFVANTAIPMSAQDFDEINAILRFVGNNVLVFVDDRTPAQNLTEQMIMQIGMRFDNDIFPTDVAAFGETSDVDADGRVIFLLTPSVNALTPPGANAQLGGFFFGLDLLPVQFSNQAEIFYSVIPDPNAQFGGLPVPIEGFVETVSATAAHEIEHMISANQHVLIRNGQSEALWLDEALAHYAETLNGFDLQNQLRSALYLEAPTFTPIVGGGLEDDTLQRRGVGWLLIAYLVEQRGQGILGDLVQTSFIDIPNVEQAANTSFPFLLHQFFLALFLDGQGVTNDPAFGFQIDLRQQYEEARDVFMPPLGEYLAVQPRTLTPGAQSIDVTVRGTAANYILVSATASGDLPFLIEADPDAELQISIVRTD